MFLQAEPDRPAELLVAGFLRLPDIDGRYGPASPAQYTSSPSIGRSLVLFFEPRFEGTVQLGAFPWDPRAAGLAEAATLPA
ncbi:MAG: hypothetical protein JO323_18155 [Acidobacteriia bacterium]|nr:hypothetical protein [Terriglobia bacterium]